MILIIHIQVNDSNYFNDSNDSFLGRGAWEGGRQRQRQRQRQGQGQRRRRRQRQRQRQGVRNNPSASWLSIQIGSSLERYPTGLASATGRAVPPTDRAQAGLGVAQAGARTRTRAPPPPRPAPHEQVGTLCFPACFEKAARELRTRAGAQESTGCLQVGSESPGRVRAADRPGALEGWKGQGEQRELEEQGNERGETRGRAAGPGGRGLDRQSVTGGPARVPCVGAAHDSESSVARAAQ